MVITLCVLFCGFCLGSLFYFLNKHNGERTALTDQLRDAQNRYGEIATQKAELQGKLSAIEMQFLQKNQEFNQLFENFQRLSGEKIAIETTRNEILKHREQLKFELASLSQEILEAKKQKFSEETQKEVGHLIADLQKEFSTFKNEIFSPETKSRTELSTHLKSLLDNVEKMHTEAENLTNALRNNSKAQGDWGEIQLENLLEQAGLSEENGDYIKQGKGLELKMEEGAAKPDFLIKLPRNQWVLIDAKVSLSAYERMVNSEDPHEREQFFQQHITSIQKHIDEIAKYHQIKNMIDICPFLIMFLPIESAYASVISNPSANKKDIAEYARLKNVIIVYPSTLFLTLRLIQAIWQVEKQNSNAQEIADRGGKLYDKFCGLLDELRELYKLFGKVHEQFDDKIIPKINGRGGLLTQCDDLQKLGAKNKKSIKKENLLES
ncbi:MAG: DNA recombination protein RmuC [Puniceicoccales bacterium]|jgi:DNA recombination protein RmuC|nr:DNA recombination protein RmuC [Puniceicoccales bacterium]